MRIVSCVQLDLEIPPPRILQLLVWLDRYGNSFRGFCWPEDRSKRIVDLRPGDWIRHRGSRYRITGLKPYREHTIEARDSGSVPSRRDEYVVRPGDTL